MSVHNLWEEHPDLRKVAAGLQRRLDAVLEAEQEAAEVVARRTATFRDRLLDAEDAAEEVEVILSNGERLSGLLRTAALDHLELVTRSRTLLVPYATVAAVVRREGR